MIFDDFKIHIYHGYVQNNFIIEYKDRLLMLDGASRPDFEKIPEFVENKIGRKIDELKLIAVTHCHPDHAGAAVMLRKHYNIPIAASEQIDLWYAGLGGIIQHFGDTIQTEYMTKKQRPGMKYHSMSYSRKLNPDYQLDSGSPLPFFNDWKAIDAPGHTYHNLIFYNETYRILYVADCVIDAGGKYRPPVPILFPEAMKSTLNRIKELKPEHLLLAHGSKPLLKYNDIIVDEVLDRVDVSNSMFIKFFYLLSKFTPEYRKHREIHDVMGI